MLLESLCDAFARVEARNFRVGEIFLNSQEIQLLTGTNEGLVRDAFDHECNRSTRDAYRELGQLVGYLWGAQVFESEFVPPKHCCALPEDIWGKPVGPAGCEPLSHLTQR
jgi:hypothetical protein